MAPMLWFIDLTVATCHIQYTFLSLCQFFSRVNGQNTRILEVRHFVWYKNGRRRLLAAQSINTGTSRWPNGLASRLKSTQVFHFCSTCVSFGRPLARNFNLLTSKHWPVYHWLRSRHSARFPESSPIELSLNKSWHKHQALAKRTRKFAPELAYGLAMGDQTDSQVAESRKFHAYTDYLGSTCVDLLWAAKRWKTCVDFCPRTARPRDEASEPLMFVWSGRKIVPLISSVRMRFDHFCLFWPSVDYPCLGK